MGASRFEFRFRYLLHAIIFTLGFWAPWNLAYPLDPRGPNAHVWGILAANVSQVTGGNLLASFNVLLILAIVCAAAGAGLRIWGTAYLGAEVVKSPNMHTIAAGEMQGVLTDGPYGHLRNPLYLGTFLHALALSLLMPRSGALFTLVLIGMFQARLILGEEAYLGRTLGAPYLAYCNLTPRILPRLRRSVAATGRHARWKEAFAAEAYFSLSTLAFVVLGWSYNAARLTQGIIVAVGLTLVITALMPRSRPVLL